jgi:hypothetical protein
MYGRGEVISPLPFLEGKKSPPAEQFFQAGISQE